MSGSRVYIYPGAGVFGDECAAVGRALGFLSVPHPDRVELAIAPRLERRLPQAELDLAPTLIFHPSILPFRRGPDAVRWTVAGGDRVAGVTWFWADAGLDTGPICEQEPVVVPRGITPRALYHGLLIPAGLRALERALRGIAYGEPRSVPQDEALATYDGRWIAPAEGNTANVEAS